MTGEGMTRHRALTRWRSVVSGALIVIAVVLAPAALLSAWLRVELVDTERFVQTFAPLGTDPAVQAFLADQTMRAVDDGVDIDGMVGDVFDGIAGIGLPPRAEDALAALQAPAAAGIRSLLSDAVDSVVASPTFASAWEAALRQSHSRAVAVLAGAPDTVVALADDGVLTVEVGVVVAAARESLIDRGFTLAERIPEVDRSVVIAESDALVSARAVYRLVTLIGAWAPLIVVALLGAGVMTARNRTAALTRAAGAVSASLALLAIVLLAVRSMLIAHLAPALMSVEAASAMFGALVSHLVPMLIALIVVFAVVAVAAALVHRKRARADPRISGGGHDAS